MDHHQGMQFENLVGCNSHKEHELINAKKVENNRGNINLETYYAPRTIICVLVGFVGTYVGAFG